MLTFQASFPWFPLVSAAERPLLPLSWCHFGQALAAYDWFCSAPDSGTVIVCVEGSLVVIERSALRNSGGVPVPGATLTVSAQVCPGPRLYCDTVPPCRANSLKGSFGLIPMLLSWQSCGPLFWSVTTLLTLLPPRTVPKATAAGVATTCWQGLPCCPAETGSFAVCAFAAPASEPTV